MKNRASLLTSALTSASESVQWARCTGSGNVRGRENSDGVSGSNIDGVGTTGWLERTGLYNFVPSAKLSLLLIPRARATHIEHAIDQIVWIPNIDRIRGTEVVGCHRDHGVQFTPTGQNENLPAGGVCCDMLLVSQIGGDLP